MQFPRAFHVQAVRPLPIPDTQPTPPPAPKRYLNPLVILTIAKDYSTHAAIVGGALYAGKIVLDTSAEIAIIAAKAKFK